MVGREKGLSKFGRLYPGFRSMARVEVNKTGPRSGFRDPAGERGSARPMLLT
jgi:hypothetical protein